MTDISRDAVDALLQGVTEGPWEAESGHEQQNGQLYWQVTDGAHAIMQNQFCWCQGDHAANARFIAAARELVPALRAALDEAEARAVKAEAERDVHTKINAEAERVAKWERDRAERLEAALTPFVDHAKHRQVGDPAWRDADAVTIIVSVEELRAVGAALKGADHE